MSEPPSKLNPDTLQRYFSSGTVTTHLVNESPEVLFVIDGPGQKISVLTPHDGTVLDVATLRRVGTGKEVRGGVKYARLTLDARGMYAEAYGLVVSILQAMQGGATFAAASSAAMTNMKALLAAKPRLPEERQVGLFGELLLFRSLLDRYDEYTVIDWWLGPLAEERDFAFPAFDAEVKTTLRENRTHVIHGTGQLEANPGRSLWLVSVQVTRAGGDPSGLSLPRLIVEIRDRLTSTRDRFVGHLAGEGWDDEDASLYPTAYVLRTPPAAYLVAEDFPAVTTSRLHSVVPHSDLVSDVSYRVDVSSRTPGDPGQPLTGFIGAGPAQEA